MTNVEDASIVKLKTQGQNFEILVDANKAIAFKEGKISDMHEVLAVQRIFSDAKKGLEASLNSVKQIFQTDDPLEVAKTIINKGEVPLTTEYKENLRLQKRKQVIDYIHRHAVDPKTNMPHPAQRIENAMNEAKVKIDEFLSVEKLVQEVLKQIKAIMPIKFVRKEIAVKIPAQYAPKSYTILKGFGELKKEEWQRDGSLIVVTEIPGGLEEDFYSKLNALCHGEIEAKVINIKGE